jgi:hypothetical protein
VSLGPTTKSAPHPFPTTTQENRGIYMTGTKRLELTTPSQPPPPHRPN